MESLKIQAIIEKSSDGGYGIYCPELEGVALYGYGETEEEAKQDLTDNLQMFAEELKDESLLKKINYGNISFDYQYDISGFFKTYSFFNVSELAKAININPSLLRKYKQGISTASDSQKQKIESAIHRLAEDLSTVHF